MIIRKYLKKDLESCAKIIKQTSEKYIVKDILPGKEAEIIGFFDINSNRLSIEKVFLEGNILVAEDENHEIIGVLKATENRIRLFFIRSDKIHQGVGTALFNKYLKSIEGKYKFIYLFSSSYAVKFYNKLGFELSGEKVLRNNGVWAYPIKKRIT